MTPRRGQRPAEWVALTLAVSLGLGFDLLAIATVWITTHPNPDLPTNGENLTQVLNTLGTGIVGIVAAFVGYVYGRHIAHQSNSTNSEDKT